MTLGDYLTARDKQYFETDTNQDLIVTEQEYVDEFMQRFDRNWRLVQLKFRRSQDSNSKPLQRVKPLFKQTILNSMRKK